MHRQRVFNARNIIKKFYPPKIYPKNRHHQAPYPKHPIKNVDIFSKIAFLFTLPPLVRVFNANAPEWPFVLQNLFENDKPKYRLRNARYFTLPFFEPALEHLSKGEGWSMTARSDATSPSPLRPLRRGPG
jgi:hypothetical protein